MISTVIMYLISALNVKYSSLIPLWRDSGGRTAVFLLLIFIIYIITGEMRTALRFDIATLHEYLF